MLLNERRIRGLLLGVALAALCAGSAPAMAQTYVGNDFSAGTSLLTALQSDGYKDNVAPFVILQEYSPAGPASPGDPDLTHPPRQRDISKPALFVEIAVG